MSPLHQFWTEVILRVAGHCRAPDGVCLSAAPQEAREVLHRLFRDGPAGSGPSTRQPFVIDGLNQGVLERLEQLLQSVLPGTDLLLAVDPREVCALLVAPEMRRWGSPLAVFVESTEALAACIWLRRGSARAQGTEIVPCGALR